MESLKRLVVLILLSAVMGGGCGSPKPANLGQLVKPGQMKDFNILLVTLDTVRQDRLGCYGYPGAHTPTLDGLAAEGVQYYDALTAVPLTLPSHTTLMTGQNPLRHGVHDNGIYALGDNPTTLSEDLQANGYQTAAFIGAFVLDSRFGLNRGFDVYDFQVGANGERPTMSDFNERPANEVTDAALQWLGQEQNKTPEKPFFAWVHYFDAHRPYQSPLQAQPEFQGRGYDAEISFVDQQMKRLLQWLEQNGLRDKTLIIITADHGESLGEHQEQAHGMFVYNSTVKVPLLINCPSRIFAHLAVKKQIAGLVDLRATISDLVGVKNTAPSDGQSLLLPVPPDRRLYLETESPFNMAGCSPLHALQSSSQKFILAPKREFFDLHKDPGEEHNLFLTHQDEADSWAQELDQLLGSASTTPVAGRQISSEEADRLRSLGYVHSANPNQGNDLPDPKAMIEVFNAGMKAEQLYAQKKYQAAAALAARVTARCKSCTAAIRVLAFSKLRMGQGVEAVEILQNAVERTGDRFLVRSLAQAQILNQDFPGALKTLEIFQALAPKDGRVHILRGDVFRKQGLLEEAEGEYRRALELDSNRSGPRARRRLGCASENVSGP